MHGIKNTVLIIILCIGCIIILIGAFSFNIKFFLFGFIFNIIILVGTELFLGGWDHPYDEWDFYL